MLKIEVDQDGPLFALDECGAQLHMLAHLLVACREPMSEDAVTGLCSLVNGIAATVSDVSVILWKDQQQPFQQAAHDGAARPPTVPNLTEPKGRARRQAAA